MNKPLGPWRLPLSVIVCLIVGFVLTASNSFSQDDSGEQTDKPKSAAAEMSAIKSSLQKQVSKLAERYHDANDAQARDEIVAERRAIEIEHVDQIFEITRERDNGNRNIRDLAWFIRRTKGAAQERVYNELVEGYLDFDDLTELITALERIPSPAERTESWLRELIEKSPNKKVQGNATLALSNYLSKLKKQAEITGDDDPLADYLNRRTGEQLDEEIESLLNDCVDKYADVKNGRRKISKTASAKLARMNLRVGKIAPDIVGVDLDDVEFKLSDYRGKVVVIDFWGDW